MNNVLTLVAEGKIEGASSKPKLVETVLSRVFIFEPENLVLKFYKRDNTWWNENMRNISAGNPRRSFIRSDFSYNNKLNPDIYLALKTPHIENGLVHLVEPSDEEDDLVIVMRMAKAEKKLTHVMTDGSLTIADYENIGRQFARAKLSLQNTPKRGGGSDWSVVVKEWIHGLYEWSGSVASFPTDLKNRALIRVEELYKQHLNAFSKIGPERFAVLIDCNLENLIYSDGKLSFIDIFPPKELWESGAFEMDIYRVATDIHIFAGSAAYQAFMKGMKEEAGEYVDESVANFYLLFGALITGPYLYMIGEKDAAYLPKAEKAKAFIESLLE